MVCTRVGRAVPREINEIPAALTHLWVNVEGRWYKPWLMQGHTGEAA